MGLAHASASIVAQVSELYDIYGRQVGYNTSSEGQTELFNWLRENPHRLHLGQIGLYLGGTEINPEAISEINKELDLWRGVLNSKFKLFGEPASVTTAVHPERDLLAVVIDSRLPRLAVRIAFPYGSPSMQAVDWNQPDAETIAASAWGWDFPMTAMTAARLGETRIAVDALLMNTEKNRYLPNGHNWQRPNLPCYLPGNGGLLYAIALMAGGWKGGPKQNAPGFPSDGTWSVRSEDLRLAD
ncbi:MAG TPA: hypothetical protein VJ784_20400 [Pyrinomonadaceae bacterium]|nr:hypothetical protein [Pyrinomonadaceae bacterium]